MGGHHQTRRVPSVEHTREEEPEKSETRGRIFNSLTSPKREEEKDELVKPEPIVPAEKKELPKRDPKPVDPADEDDEDDWGAVPAFLRRSKLK